MAWVLSSHFRASNVFHKSLQCDVNDTRTVIELYHVSGFIWMLYMFLVGFRIGVIKQNGNKKNVPHSNQYSKYKMSASSWTNRFQWSISIGCESGRLWIETSTHIYQERSHQNRMKQPWNQIYERISFLIEFLCVICIRNDWSIQTQSNDTHQRISYYISIWMAYFQI